MHHNTTTVGSRSRWAAVIAVLPVLVALSACGGRLPDRGTVVAGPGEPLVIGVLSTAAGPLASEGEGVAQAVQLAVEQQGGVRGRQVQVAVAGGGCDPAEAEQAAARFVADARVIGLVGPLCSPACVAAEVEIAHRSLVMVSPRCSDIAVTRQGYPNVLRTVYSDSFNAAAAARLANDVLKVKSTFLIHDGTLYGRGMRDVFKFVYGKNKLSGNVEALPGTQDYGAVVRSVKGSSAGLVFYAGFPEDAARFITQLRAGGVSLPVVLTDTALAPPGLAALAGAAAEDVYVLEPAPKYDGRYRQFSTHYEQRFGAPPPPYAAEAYDAASAILRAAGRSARTTGEGMRIDRRALQEAARDARFAGASGPVQFRRNGDRREGVAVRLLQVAGGTLVVRRTIELDG